MGQLYPDTVQRLINEFNRLPGVGQRSAERLAFHVLASSRDDAMALAVAIRDVKQSMRACNRCFHVTDSPLCLICSDPERDNHTICVVELPRDVIALEKCGIYRGVYHVLQGHLDPLVGVAPENLRISELLARIGAEGTEEVIFALNPTTEGDATTHYLAEALREKYPDLRITNLARGLASGVDIETAAQSSLMAAVRGRTPF